MNKQTEEALNMIDTLLNELKQGSDEWTLLSHKGNHPENCWVGRVLMACKAALQEDALDRMADNARELGLEWKNEQEPVAWRSEGGMLTEARLQAESWVSHGGKATPLYTRPIKRLSDEQINQIAYELDFSVIDFARAIENKLMEINK